MSYPRLSPGGYCIIDDYKAFPDCARAVQEYRAEHDIGEIIQPIDNMAAFWKKS